MQQGEQRFGWTRFYSEIADRLTKYRDNRRPLITGLEEIAGRMSNQFPRVLDTYKNGTQGFLRDICPFTTIGCFNRGTKDETRREIAKKIRTFLNVQEPTPNLTNSQDGIPQLNPTSWWYFAKEQSRDPNDIDKLWEVFGDTINFFDGNNDGTRELLERSFDKAISVKFVGISKLTIGMFWIRPWGFPTLDKKSIPYIRDVLGENIPKKYKPDGSEYMRLRDSLIDRFNDPDCPVRSFPELSFSAYTDETSGAGKGTHGNGANGTETSVGGSQPSRPATGAERPYTIMEILSEGCFLPREKLEVALERLRQRKNMILQGPPGTGKTWLAKRLAYTLIGYKDERLVKRYQFHPNLSYEDFVRGHRPDAGKLELVDGPFLEVVKAAQGDLDNKYVVVIEEINRGNPAQIFGEMLTLLESDKRNEDEALALAVARVEDERIHIPPNVYVIGTMNVADRSLALVDLALRRRFTFVDLEPTFGEPWRSWMHKQGGVDDSHLRKIEQRMTALNEVIAADQSLGKQFRVGHSYVTTPRGAGIDDPVTWFREVVETEIAPLLREYWFDQTKTAEDQARRLLEDL